MRHTQRPRNIVVLQPVSGRGMVPSSLIEPSRLQNEPLQINVLFTDIRATEVALRCAAQLASDLEAETKVIVPHVVPYPLDIENPAVPLEFTCSKLRIMAAAVGADPYINVYLCRDVMDLLQTILPVDSIVVLGARRQWLAQWRAHRIARKLKKNGCQVILAQYS